MHKFFNPRRDFANIAKAEQARIKDNQQAWNKVPLRDFIRDNPTMQALNPILKMRFETEHTRDYARIRNIISKVLHNDMEAGEQVEQQLASTMKHIAKLLNEKTVSTCQENHIPGFRTIVFMNLDIIPDVYHNNSRKIRMAAVTDDGRLVMNILQGSKAASRLQSTAEILEVVLSGRTGWEIIPDDGNYPLELLYSFDLNKHSDISIKSQNGIGYIIRDILKKCRIDGDTFEMMKIRNHIVKIVLKNANHNFNMARMTLCNALDPDTLRDIRAGQITKLFQVQWLTGSDGVNLTQIQARKQAVNAYPIMADEFTKTKSFREAIDTRESLSKAIAINYNVPQSRVRNIQGLSRQWIACDNEADAYLKAGQILASPNRIVPRTRKQIRQLDVLEDFAHIVLGEDDLDRNTLPRIMTRISAEGHLWTLVDKLEEHKPANVRDAVNFLADKLFIPAAINGIRQTGGELSSHCENNARQKILTSFKIRELLEFSERYHRNIHRWEDRLTSISFQKDWPGLLGTIELEDGYVARELTSSKDLKIQGRAEDHCVGGYMPAIVEGDTCDNIPVILIFSIEKNGTVLSTAEINCTESDHGLQAWVERNEGYSNAIPPESSSAMADLVALKITQIKFDAWQAYLDGLQRVRIEMEQIPGVDRYARACGFDPHDRNMLERVWKELRSALPRAMRRSGIDAFIDWIREELSQDPPQSMYNSVSNASDKQKQSGQCLVQCFDQCLDQEPGKLPEPV